MVAAISTSLALADVGRGSAPVGYPRRVWLLQHRGDVASSFRLNGELRWAILDGELSGGLRRAILDGELSGHSSHDVGSPTDSGATAGN
jgi:hypothetical protein